MYYPLATLPVQKRRQLLIILAVLNLIIIGIFSIIDQPLRTTAAPQGIISYQVAGSVPRVQDILNSWDEEARIYAGFSLGFDFLFMPLYAAAITLACTSIAQRFQTKSYAQYLGYLLAWGQSGAAILDATENISQFFMLLNTPTTPWPQITYGCAMLKFMLIASGIGYSVIGMLWSLKNK